MLVIRQHGIDRLFFHELLDPPAPCPPPCTFRQLWLPWFVRDTSWAFISGWMPSPQPHSCLRQVTSHPTRRESREKLALAASHVLIPPHFTAFATTVDPYPLSPIPHPLSLIHPYDPCHRSPPSRPASWASIQACLSWTLRGSSSMKWGGLSLSLGRQPGWQRSGLNVT